MQEIVISLHDIKKRYGMNKVLKGVNLDIEKGKIYGLVGKNGSGKTTLFKIILGLSDYQGGSIRIGDEDSSIKEGRSRIGFFIGTHFFSYMNGKQNLKYYCRLKGVSTRGEVNRVLKIVGLDGVKSKVGAYSLGMKHRLGIATALLGNPEILILDEPTNGLDPQGIADIRNILKEINKEFGTTIIISSHILGELQNTADHFAILDEGVIKDVLSQNDLQTQSEYEYLKLRAEDIPMATEVLEHVGISVLAHSKEKVSLEDYYFHTIGSEKDENVAEEGEISESQSSQTAEETQGEDSATPGITEVEEIMDAMDSAKTEDVEAVEEENTVEEIPEEEIQEEKEGGEAND